MDATTGGRKVLGDTHEVSRDHAADHLLITKGTLYLDNGELWRPPPLTEGQQLATPIDGTPRVAPDTVRYAAHVATFVDFLDKNVYPQSTQEEIREDIYGVNLCEGHFGCSLYYSFGFSLSSKFQFSSEFRKSGISLELKSIHLSKGQPA